jgi:hypothetical protein
MIARHRRIPIEAEDSSPPPEETKPLSDAMEFRITLLGVPSPIELDFGATRRDRSALWAKVQIATV